MKEDCSIPSNKNKLDLIFKNKLDLILSEIMPMQIEWGIIISRLKVHYFMFKYFLTIYQ